LRKQVLPGVRREVLVPFLQAAGIEVREYHHQVL
jgi:hypothetical protein